MNLPKENETNFSWLHLSDLHRGTKAELARVYKRYKAIVESPSWNQIVVIGKRMLLLPGSVVPDGDPWIQLAVNILRAQVTTQPQST